MTYPINVKDYGAKGDGVTDDYAAIENAVAAINSARGGTLVFPPGKYYINQHKIVGGPNSNTVVDIIYRNCSGLSIIGYGATVAVKGDFKRSADYMAAGLTYSYSQSVIPFSFVNCTRFELCGFELNGNVNLMTRDPGVVEGVCHGISTNGCTDYGLRDLYVHHFAADGIVLGTGTTADKRAHIAGVRSLFNARDGMSIIQLRGATILSSESSESGNTGGAYGHHAPAAGVDIEPDYNTTTTPAVDVLTGHITFIECKFTNNVGNQFVAAYASNSERIRLRDCELIAGTSSSAFPVVLAVNDGIIDDSYIDTGGEFMQPSYGAPFDPNQQTTLRKCEIRSANRMLVTDLPATVTISDCRFIGTGTVPHSGSYPIYIQNPKCTFRNNYIFFPKEMYAGSGTYDIVGLIQHVRLARDNVYETDMNPTANQATAGQHFAIDYSSARIVQNESYVSAGEPHTGFRSGYNAVWDNALPYSNGYGSIGSSIVTQNLDRARNNRIVMVQAMPITGSWNKGDIALLANPVKGERIGWTRLTSGNGNILNTDWQPFGTIDS